jgi:parallel beta-helix repeat protein
MRLNRSASWGVIVLTLISMLVLAPNTAWARVVALSPDGGFRGLADPPTGASVILHQDFDNETTGAVPANGSLTDPKYGNITVDQTVYIGDHGKSGKFLDNSTLGSPGANVGFSPQSGTVIVSFAIRLVNNTGINTGLEVRVDDGTSSGANIVFGDGLIGYRDQNGQLITLRPSYVAARWYRIKFIMDVSDNVYNIHVDEHLEAVNVKFTGPCSQVHRIVINETYSTQWGALLPIGYIDDVDVRRGIVIPTDFATIQDGVDSASPGDVVIVSQNRTYFESVTIRRSLWLVGQNISTTIIDGRFASAAPTRISVLGCSNVTIYGFTIGFSAAGGAQIYVEGSGNTVTNNLIISGQGDAVSIVGSGNTVSNNTIRSHAQCSVRVDGSNSTVTGNIIESSDDCGIRIVGSNSSVRDNRVQSSLNAGVDVSGSNQNISNNVINSTGNLGIHVTGSSATVADNVVRSSGHSGIRISQGGYNLGLNNTVMDSGVGLECEADSSNGKFYQNRFVGNAAQALDNGVGNRWDDGYPYSPEKETGGGNYWSDFFSVDLYSGPGQNERADLGLPSPDGICDAPYKIQPNSTDHYPLFLIQGVAQTPKADGIDRNLNVTIASVDYSTKVNVTATVLKYVQVVNASVYVVYNGTTSGVVPMNVSGNNLTGTIPVQPYGTTVRYNVSARAYEANWLNSTSYPIPFPYLVQDWTPPSISGIKVSPSSPNENQTITVYVNVTEPAGASQVARVLISYQVNNTWWTAQMTKLVDDNYTATFPKQAGKTSLNFTITAYDNAGNNATQGYPPTAVNGLAELSVVYGGSADDPCSIDLGIVSGDQTMGKTFTVKNLGNETLSWTESTVKGGPWLKSVTPSTGSVAGGQSVSVNVTVDTSQCPDPSLYAVELSVKGNGKVPQWAVIETFTVRFLVIDQSWASSEAPNRCNINDTQYYAFHAKWANNCSAATGGTITLAGMTVGLPVNDTGWGNFNYTSSNPMSRTFRVGKVQFGNITASRQLAPNRTTIWDRVYLNLSIAHDWIDVGSMADVSWNNSYYESDNSTFRGAPIFNPPPIHDTVGRYPINASSVDDYNYHLTAFRCNTVWCVWDEIEIIAGGVSSSRLNVGQTGTVWYVAVYEYENKLFKGANGTLYTNGIPLTWSSVSEVWTGNYARTCALTEAFRVTGVKDNVHNLTRTKDNVGPLEITWGPKFWLPSFGLETSKAPSVSAKDQSSTSGAQVTGPKGVVGHYPWVVLVIALAAGIGMVATMLLLASSGKKHSRGRSGKKQE